MMNEQDNRSVELLTVIAKALLAPIMDNEFADPKMSKLYDMTGEATADQAAAKLKLGKRTVIDVWKRWERLGLIVKDGRTYRKVL